MNAASIGIDGRGMAILRDPEIPESPDVLQASNAGNPVILDAESPAGQAYADAVARFLGEERPHRFLEPPKKKGFFEKLFGGKAA